MLRNYKVDNSDNLSVTRI